VIVTNVCESQTYRQAVNAARRLDDLITNNAWSYPDRDHYFKPPNMFMMCYDGEDQQVRNITICFADKVTSSGYEDWIDIPCSEIIDVEIFDDRDFLSPLPYWVLSIKFTRNRTLLFDGEVAYNKHDEIIENFNIIRDYYKNTKTVHSISGMSFTDQRDGQTYKYVKIGRQVWMAENLNYQTTNSRCYDNSPSNCNVYGRLYPWVDTKQACPSGWHLPSHSEWIELVDFLGGEDVAGGKMKITGTTYWKHSNFGATNESGFSALPGGSGGDVDRISLPAAKRYVKSSFSGIWKYANFWSSSLTLELPDYAWGITLYSSQKDLNQDGVGHTLTYDMSVRCIKD